MKSLRWGIAPHDLIQKDFREMDAVEKLRTTWETERLIFIQSIQGHAHEGHGKFRPTRYPNTSIDDIARALRLDPAWVRAERQQLIDEIRAYVDRVIAGEERPHLGNGEGVGLLSSSMFNSIDVPGRDVLRGLYLGGLRDNAEVRFEMERRYGITIGGGKCYLVNTEVMDRLGLNGEVLAHGAHEDMIEYYRDTGLIVGDRGRDGAGVDYMYIRYRRGRGASDDAAIIAAGLLHGYGTAVGVFLADAIDTLEKYVPVFSDQDQELARHIEANYKDLDVNESHIRRLTFISAEPEEAEIEVPDCSLRHLMLVDRKRDLTAIESHLLFVQGRRVPPLKIGHEGTLNKSLYQYIENRLMLAPGIL